MKYRFRLHHGSTTLAFSNSEATLERIRSVMDLPQAEITPTKTGPRQVIWAGAKTPIEIGGKES